MRSRLTFTYARGDIAERVAEVARLRGCDQQAVINDVLAAHFIDGRLAQLEEQCRLLQATLRHMIGQAPAAPVEQSAPDEYPTPIPVALPRNDRRNRWEVLE